MQKQYKHYNVMQSSKQKSKLRSSSYSTVVLTIIPQRIDQLLSTHRDILQRIRGIYQFIQSFCEGKDMQYIHELLLGTNSMNNSSNSSNSSNSNSNSHSSRPQRNEMMEHSYTMTIAFFLDMEQCDQHMNRYMTSINNLYTQYVMYNYLCLYPSMRLLSIVIRVYFMKRKFYLKNC
jgi:hypothetical protein